MNELPAGIQQRIDRYLSVSWGGLTLWPVTVENAGLFGAARAALDLIPQSLPVALISMPVLDAFYQLDLEARETNGETLGLVGSVVLLLKLALRLGAADGGKALAEGVRIYPDEKRPGRLREIVFLTEEGETVRVSPRLFQKIRPILAAQNGVDMPSDTANPEILEAERMMAMKEFRGIDPKLTDKIIFVAQGSGVSEEEIWNWPILKLERHASLLRRRLDYLAVKTGEMSGMVKFTDGNPVPSPYWARKRGLYSLQSLGAVGNGAAEAAVRNAEARNQQ